MTAAPSALPSLPARAGLVLRFRWVLLAVVALAVVAYALAERDLAFGAAIAIACLSGWIVTEIGENAPRRGLPRWASTLILVGVLTGAALRVFQGTPAVSAFAQFLCAIIAVKLWERRQLRDYGQILTLSLFLLVAATLTGTSLAVGLALVLAVPLLATGAMMYQVLAAAARAGGAFAVAPTAVLVRLSVAMTLLALPISVAVFVLIPRGLWFQELGALRRTNAQRVTGFADEVDLNRTGAISQSSARVMDLRVRAERSGQRLGGVGERYYLRGSILPNYEDGRWFANPPGPGVLATTVGTGQFVRIDEPPASGPILYQEITCRPGPRIETPVFAAYRPYAIEFGEIDSDLRILTNPRVSTVSRQGARGEVTYRVWSAPGDAPVPEPDRDPDRRGHTSFQLPSVKRLAIDQLRLAGIEPDPDLRPRDEDATTVRKLEAFLRMNFSYSLSPPATPLGREPLEYFLLESRTGHCEYFASALAAMCRSVGIEARVVTGYLASEFDETTGAYTIRESNAHAWVEACIAPGLWRTFDATPPAQLSALTERQTSLLGRFSQALDRLEESWNTSVVGFDRAQQARLWGTGQGRISWLDRASEWARESGRERRSLSLPVIPSIGAGVVILVIVIGVWRWRRRARAGASSGWALEPRSRRLYLGLLRELRRRRCGDKPDWMPMAEFLRTIHHAHPDTALAAAQVLRHLAEANFASTPDPRSGVRRAEDALRALRKLP